MKTKWVSLGTFFLASGVLLTGAAPALSTSIRYPDSHKPALQLTALLPQLQPKPDEIAREELLRSVATALARSGKFQAAQQAAEMIPQRKWDFNIRDEVRRLLVRQLAQRGNIEAALKNTTQIQGEYFRADALMAIARAHLRAKNKPGALGVLHTAAPIVRTSKSSQATAYLAWLFIQADDEKTARSLFALANKTKSNQRMEVTLGDHGKQSIAFYQTKAGWLDEALTTAGTNSANLVSIKAELIGQEKWKALHQLAAKQSGFEAVDSLLDLASHQCRVLLLTEARETLVLAKSRLSAINQKQRESPDGIYPQVLLSVLEIVAGNEAQGRARFANLSKLRAFQPDHELLFHSLLMEPYFLILQSKSQQVKNEKVALAFVAKMPKDRSIRHLLAIAKIQQKRGDNAAMQATLQLTRAAVQAYVKKPLHEEKDRDTLLWVGAGYLLDVAQMEKQSGNSAYRSTLSAARQLISRDREVRIASALLRRGFEAEAEVILNRFVALKITDSNEYGNSLEELPSLAATQTHESKNSGALDWVSKIKDISVQAEALSKMLIVLNPLPEEERELILRGDKTHGAQVSSQFSLPGYAVSQNFSEFE